MTRRDEDALNRAIQAHKASVYRTAYNHTLNRMDAEDIMQEVFLRYAIRAPAFESIEREKAWLLRVAINLCKTFKRSAWFRRSVPFFAREIPADADNPVLESIQLLRPIYRIVVYMYYYEGYSVGEIAKIVNASETAIQSRLHRARHALKGILEDET